MPSPKLETATTNVSTARAWLPSVFLSATTFFGASKIGASSFVSIFTSLDVKDWLAEE